MDNLTRGKRRLLLHHPFFASKVLDFEYIEDEKVGTASICRKVIKYNPKFVDSLPVQQSMTLLAHELLHHLLMHGIRGIGKNSDVWNQAADYVVNLILHKSKFELPTGGLLDYKYEGMDADQVYQILMKDQKDNQQNGNQNDPNAPQNWGKVEAVPDDEKSEAEAEAKKDAAEAMAIGKQAGDLPGDMESIIHDILEPQKDWRELLLKFIAEIAQNDYTWTKPSQRYVPMGLYLPKLESIELGKVVFAIDTSSSVDVKLLAQFVSEIKEASTLFDFPVTVIHCDTKVRHVEELDEDSTITPKGRGGTSFTPVFDWVNENMPDIKALVYFTDGECWDRLTEPDYETLWVIYDNKNFKPQFGDVVHIN